MVKPVSLDKPKVPELVAFGEAVRRRRKELSLIHI